DYNVCAHKTWIEYLPDGETECLNTQRGLDKINRDYLTMRDYVAGVYFHTSATMFRNLFRGNLPRLMKTAIVGDLPLTMLHVREKKIKVLDEYMSVRVKAPEGLSSQQRFNPAYNLGKIRGTHLRLAWHFRNRLSLIFLYRYLQLNILLLRYRVSQTLKKWAPGLFRKLKPSSQDSQIADS
ncbi:MAG: hypothetical protein ACR2NP_14200, partial [Pirellulaceae bacterium]